MALVRAGCTNNSILDACPELHPEDIEQALSCLRLVFGDEFEIGHDEEGYWAYRHGEIGDLVDEGSVGAILQHLYGRLVSLSERINFLSDAVFAEAEIAGFESVDVVTLAVGDGETQHHHVDLHAEGRPLLLGEQRQGNCQQGRGNTNE